MRSSEAALVLVAAAGAAAVLSVTSASNGAVGAAAVMAALAIPLVAVGALLRRRPRAITGADRVTLTRVVLIGVLTAAWVLILFEELPARTWAVVAVAAVALALDALDGWVARRMGQQTSTGARLDVEADAAALLVLSGLLAFTVGWWVLVIGLMRYIYWAVSWVRPRLRGIPPFSAFRRTVGAFQGLALVLGLVPVMPVPAAAGVAAAALGMLAVSFARDVLHLERSAHQDDADSAESSA